MPLIDAQNDKILNRIYRTDPGSLRPAAIHVGLFKTIPTKAGASGAELAMTGYARVAVSQADASWDLAASVITNVAAIAFPQLTAGGPERAIGFGVFDAASAGNLLQFGALATGWVGAAAKASTDAFTRSGHGFANGNRVFVRGESIPAGLDHMTEYFVVGVSGDTFQVSLTSGGAAVNITADGACEVGLSKAQDIADGNTPKILAGQLALGIGG